MEILTKKVKTEISIKNSRFIAELIPIKTQIEARTVLKEQKKRYEDASHVVHAFICGLNCEIMGSSDDGEPSGTAGRPILDVLKGKNCTNVLLTVTRYFGGILLGTGGLVKAYSDSAKAVIALGESQKLFEVYIPKKNFSFSLSYDLHDKITRLCTSFHITDKTESFSENIVISGNIYENEVDRFFDELKEMTSGKVIAKLIDTDKTDS